MPYNGEYANKTSHFDIVKNPEVQRFLNDCEYLKEPSDEEIEQITSVFEDPPEVCDVTLPEKIIAVDGSSYESSINDKLPSTKIGYVKVGCVLINLQQYKALRLPNGFVDPFRVASLQNNNTPISFPLPSANIKSHGKQTVRDSFRAIMDEHFRNTMLVSNEPSTSLRATLFHLASLRTGELGTKDVTKIRIHKCPSCEQGPIDILESTYEHKCEHCGEVVYATDCLRIWEEVTEYQSNIAAINRFMIIVEHLIPVNYIRLLSERSLESLSELAFFVDGPLAVFGTGAWLHSGIMRFLYTINERLIKKHKQTILVVGLQKTGQVVDHATMICRFIKESKLFIINDEYRYKYILAGRDPSNNGFGYETYYGQDFIYRTSSGRIFVFGLPYPFESKERGFLYSKTELDRYKQQLPRALALINNFESDLYENAVVPVALAHRYTAISLAPGGKVLDLLTKDALNR